MPAACVRARASPLREVQPGAPAAELRLRLRRPRPARAGLRSFRPGARLGEGLAKLAK